MALGKGRSGGLHSPHVHDGVCALKAPGIVIAYLSAPPSRNSERSNAVAAPMANEYLNTAKKSYVVPPR